MDIDYERRINTQNLYDDKIKPKRTHHIELFDIFASLKLSKELRYMINRKFVLLLCAAVLLGCTKELTLTEENKENAAIVAGSLIVEFDEQTADAIEAAGFLVTKSDAQRELLEELGLKSAKRVFPDAGEWEPRHREAGLHRVYRVVFDESTPITKAVSGIEGLPGVISAEPEPRKVMNAGITFNDKYAMYQWGLYNAGSSYYKGFTQGADINVLPVWEQYTAGSPEVIVAVIDSGVDMNNADLKGVVIPGTASGGSRSFVHKHEGSTITADEHGTHVAGIIGAINNNGKSVCGVAGGKDGKGGVRILACQMMQETEDEDEILQGDSAAAIVYAADNGAVIAQNSWGYDGNVANIDAADKKAIDYFIANAGKDKNGNQVGPMAGGLVLFAAGNENTNKCYPAMYAPTIAVGAYGGNGKRAWYSNYGSWVDICAPGGDADDNTQDEEPYIWSTAPNNTILGMVGTSQACPHVSGVAALLISHFGGPGLTNDMVRECLINGARANSTSATRPIGPYVDALGAFKAMETLLGVEDGDNPEKILPIIASHDYSKPFNVKSHESIALNFYVSNAEDKKVSYSLDCNSAAVSGETTESGYTIYINAFWAKPGNVKATLSASFEEGLTSSLDIEFTILPNNAPVLAAFLPDQIVENEMPITLDLSKYFSDLDDEILRYDVEMDNNMIASAVLSNGILELRATSFGRTKIRVKAYDTKGVYSSENVFDYVYYDMEKGASSYPNPVVNVLNVNAGTEKVLNITLTNAYGRVLYQEICLGSALDPVQIDMSSYPAGRYGLVVKYDGKQTRKTIVKK